MDGAKMASDLFGIPGNCRVGNGVRARVLGWVHDGWIPGTGFPLRLPATPQVLLHALAGRKSPLLGLASVTLSAQEDKCAK